MHRDPPPGTIENGADTTKKDSFVEAAKDAPLKARKAAVAEMMNSATDGSERELITEAVKRTTLDARKAAAAEAVNSAADRNKKDVAAEAVQALPEDAKKAMLTKAAQSLGRKDQEEVAECLGSPDQKATNRIWQMIVAAFAVVFVGSSIALIVAVFFGPEDIQLLLTVVTTVAGILAGFVSGRASSGMRPG
jgi:CHASE3 domain sensor protein